MVRRRDISLGILVLHHTLSGECNSIVGMHMNELMKSMPDEQVSAVKMKFFGELECEIETFVIFNSKNLRGSLAAEE